MPPDVGKRQPLDLRKPAFALSADAKPPAPFIFLFLDASLDRRTLPVHAEDLVCGRRS